MADTGAHLRRRDGAATSPRSTSRTCWLAFLIGGTSNARNSVPVLTHGEQRASVESDHYRPRANMAS